MNDKVQEIKEYIKEAFLHSKVPFIYDAHLKAVEKNCLWLLERLPEADKEVVMLGCWLHDMQYVVDYDDKANHEVLGAEEAGRVMVEFGYDEDIIKKVQQIILSHSCKKHMPETLEAKILASADGMAHFFNDFYLSLFKKGIGCDDIAEFKKFTLNKIEYAFNHKIFFDFAKEYIAPRYEVIKAFMLLD